MEYGNRVPLCSTSRRRHTHTQSRQLASPGFVVQGDMAAAAAAAVRCFRAMPAARSALQLPRSRTPSLTAIVAELPRAGCATQQVTLEEVVAKLMGQTGVAGADAVATGLTGNERLSAVLPTLEAVNRNARRPKKVRCPAGVQRLVRPRMLFRDSRPGRLCARGL